MIELVTEANKTQLNDKQLQAIDLILIGNTDDQVAKYVGVNRSTVNQWKNHNIYFQAELNRRRKEIWEATLDELRSLLSGALRTIKQAIDQGDAKIALEVLKMAGLDMREFDSHLGEIGIGWTTPEEIMKWEERENKNPIDKILDDLLS